MRLLSGAWKILVGIKDGLVLLLMLLFFGVLYALLTASPNPVVPGNGALHLNLEGIIVEQPEETNPFDALTGGETIRQHRLRDIVQALESAATDDRVTAVALDLDGFFGGGQTAIARVGDAIQTVRDADKPVIAFATGYGDDAYALAAHASEIWVHPMGGALILGPGGNRLYYGDMLRRFGVTANIFRAGEFKSAVEPYSRADQSPEAREASQALADSLFEAWREDVARARPDANIDAIIATPADLVEAANNDLATAARDAGMVDEIGTRLDWQARIAEISGEDVSNGFQAIRLANWIAANPRSGGSSNIGVVTVAGTIVDGEAPAGTAGGETIADLLREASENYDFSALVLRVDSPGGSALASERIRRAVLSFAETEGDIPVVVSMGNLAASGGYWVATAGDHIMAEPGTITGSIGVFSIIPSFEGTLDQLDIGADGVTTTPLSGEPDVFGGISPEAQRLLQSGTEDIYRRFLSLVSENRDMPVERIAELAEGRVWAGGTARQLGLVDAFGNLDEAIAEAASRAEVEADDVRVLWIEQPPDPFTEFIRNWTRDEDDAQQTAAPRDIWTMLAPDPRAILATVMAEMQLLMTGPAMQLRCLECPVDVIPGRTSAADAATMRVIVAEWLG
ncbi:signal peptide peptidase SppA [Parasphingopyxis sp. CP4]|uniref:signal peptide peptidase SppA n=1 Tax=Parasphingopyxis sp. CP4 TaxID=2724527 RepID=UPI00159FCBB3|nr:signal peptide peptidase SppA [Parasphingopyxis sp. CP4]QLC22184.1 signal peptide peptidase SppA [Parasphingopyxis sp. CP4]